MSKKVAQNGFLCFFSFIYYSLISSPYGYPDVGIDASWTEALAMTIDGGKIFGRDFIFNYGPLGYLNTGILPKSVSILTLVTLHVATLANYLFMIWYGFRQSDKNWKYIAIASLCILLPWGFISDVSFTYFYFFLFWLLYAQQTQSRLGLSFALLCALLLFYVKVNLSLIVYTLFIFSLGYFWFCRVFSFKILFIVLSLLLFSTYALSLVLNVDIAAYLSASLKIIDAYQDAMAVVIATKYELVFFLSITALILLSVSVVVMQNFRTIWPDKKLILLFGFVAVAWFLDFKQAHTAISFPNLLGYYIFMPPLVVLLYLFVPKSMRQSISLLFVVVFGLQLAAIQAIRYRSAGATFRGYALSFVADDIEKKSQKGLTNNDILAIVAGKTPYNYIKNAITYNYEDYFRINRRPLPITFLKKYGQTNIDIVPTEIDYVYFNKLNYNPRPVIQSYQANSDWLMAKNGEKYLSASAPETVLFRVQSFRDQNPFWVETDLTKALLCRYQITDTVVTKTDSFLVFTKNKIVKNLNYRLLQNKRFTLNEDIDIIKSDKPIEFSAKIEYGFLGKIARLLFQPPYLYCIVTYENGNQERYRVIDKILKGGIIINRKVSTQAEVATFFGQQPAKNIRVAKIHFWAKYQWGFKPEFDINLKEITVK